MRIFVRMIVVGVFAGLVIGSVVHAEEVSREQLKGLDEQVQEIKNDVLSIVTELNQLEEKLLYPSHTQVAVFVSLAEGETFRLDSVEIDLDGKVVAHHLYTYKELEALRKGGVQRIYTGNLMTGAHEMRVRFKGQSGGGDDFENTESFTMQKDVAPGFVEVVLAKQAISFQEQ